MPKQKTPKPTKRGHGGKFTKGTGGGPGRPKGIANKVSLNLRAEASLYSHEALDKIVGFLRGKSKPMAFAAAREILDRAHGKATQAVDIDIAGLTVILGSFLAPSEPGGLLIEGKANGHGGNGASDPSAS